MGSSGWWWRRGVRPSESILDDIRLLFDPLTIFILFVGVLICVGMVVSAIRYIRKNPKAARKSLKNPVTWIGSFILLLALGAFLIWTFST